MEQLIYRERKHTNSTKWDSCKEKFGKEDLLAMWVADMDFEAPSCVAYSAITSRSRGIRKRSFDGKRNTMVMR